MSTREPLLLTAFLALAFYLIYLYNRRRSRLFLGTVPQVELSAFHSSVLNNQRDIVVYLPPGYNPDCKKGYPLLLVNDGQDRDQLQLRQTLARLYAHASLEPLIAVAVPTGEQRLQEYGTSVAANAQGYGKRAHAYEQFIVQELLPFLEEEFSVTTHPSERAFLGASLGGLSAFDIAWGNRHLFGIVGVFSGSFWWRAAANETQVAAGRRIAHQLIRSGLYSPGFRVWFEAGTRDERSDRDQNGVIDAIQDTLELIEEMEKLGYGQGEEIVYHEVGGGRHNYATWSAVLPAFLHWAFPNGRGRQLNHKA